MIFSESIRLDGYSGCEVTLYKDRDGNYVVRKKATLLEQNLRLVSQYKKHAFFSAKNSKSFSVPEIIECGYQNKLFWYSYRFIEGITLLHYIETESFERIRPVLSKVIDIVKEHAGDPTHFEVNTQAYFPALNQKLYESYKRISRADLPHDLFDKFQIRVSRLDYDIIPTLCHGDFTLDNIIVSPDQSLWLIDFVEIFYPHWWFDVSKFFQDIDGGWYELTRGVRLQYNKLMYVREYLMKNIDAIDERYKSAHSFLVALHLLRNIPFLRDSSHLTASEKRRVVAEKILILLEL